MSAADLRLWLDWCTAREIDPDRAVWEHVQAFATDTPVADSTRARRLGTIRAHYQHRHQELAGAPIRATAALWPPEAGPEALQGRLWALPAYGFPHGVTGRRDAVIHVLAAMGLNRAQIVALRPAAVTFDPVLAITGVDVDMTNHGLRCPKCALTRWLRVLSTWWLPDGEHSVEREVEHQPADVRQHDCARPVPDGWQHAPRLVCGVDRGLLLSPALGHRAVTRALSRTAVWSPEQAAPSADRVIPLDSPPHDPSWRGPTPAERIGPLRELEELLDQLDKELDDHLAGESG